MKSRLLQLTSSPSGHQVEILSFIGSHPWHVKGLSGKVVWIAKMNLIVLDSGAETPRYLSLWSPRGRNFCQDTNSALIPDAHESLHILS